MKGLLVSTAIAMLLVGLVQWSLKGADACTQLFMLGVPGSEYCVLLQKKPEKLVDIPLPRPRPNPGHDLAYADERDLQSGPTPDSALHWGDWQDNLTIDEAQRRVIGSKRLYATLDELLGLPTGATLATLKMPSPNKLTILGWAQ